MATVGIKGLTQVWSSVYQSLNYGVKWSLFLSGGRRLENEVIIASSAAKKCLICTMADSTSFLRYIHFNFCINLRINQYTVSQKKHDIKWVIVIFINLSRFRSVSVRKSERCTDLLKWLTAEDNATEASVVEDNAVKASVTCVYWDRMSWRKRAISKLNQV